MTQRLNRLSRSGIMGPNTDPGDNPQVIFLRTESVALIITVCFLPEK